MADLDGNINAKDWGLDSPQRSWDFHIREAGQLDFGMRQDPTVALASWPEPVTYPCTVPSKTRCD